MSIKINNVSYIYNPNSHFQSIALDDVTLEIKENEFIGLIGHTGSGKSTLVQLLNGLLLPTKGNVEVDGHTTSVKDKGIIEVRQKVGLVFQYPEYQLFEETIALDIAFGPKNLGLNEQEIEERVKYSMNLVGLDYEQMKDVSPFDLSGGQKRRVAIASVLAMKPKYLILDEPTAGLDPQGRDEILGEIKKIYDDSPEITIIIVSHSMEDIARLAKRVIVMHTGKVFADDTPRNVYERDDELEAIGLDVPQITKATKLLKQKGYVFEDTILTVEEAYEAIRTQMGGAKDAN
ncbi:MAG: energy-coupling factor transporter ATPase [Tissierellia bacterium]|nr:energy-coupling factor transporter ATPase [Tissierellia bacterium]